MLLEDRTAIVYGGSCVICSGRSRRIPRPLRPAMLSRTMPQRCRRRRFPMRLRLAKAAGVQLAAPTPSRQISRPRRGRCRTSRRDHAPSQDGACVKLDEQVAGTQGGEGRRYQRRDENGARFAHPAAVVGVDGDGNPRAVLAGLEAAKNERQAAQTFHAEQVRPNWVRNYVACVTYLRRDRRRRRAAATFGTAPAATGLPRWLSAPPSAICSA